jgi:hypothetical protein
VLGLVNQEQEPVEEYLDTDVAGGMQIADGVAEFCFGEDLAEDGVAVFDREGTFSFIRLSLVCFVLI